MISKADKALYDTLIKTRYDRFDEYLNSMTEEQLNKSGSITAHIYFSSDNLAMINACITHCILVEDEMLRETFEYLSLYINCDISVQCDNGNLYYVVVMSNFVKGLFTILLEDYSYAFDMYDSNVDLYLDKINDTILTLNKAFE